MNAASPLSVGELQTLIVRSGFRTAAKRLHPDLGAEDRVDFDDLKAARETLLTLVAVNESHDPMPEPAVILIRSKFASDCRLCGAHIPAGHDVAWKEGRGVAHIPCWEEIR